jgi:hypothetical protein
VSLSDEHLAAVNRVLEALRGVRSPAHALVVLEDAAVACSLGHQLGLTMDSALLL